MYVTVVYTVSIQLVQEAMQLDQKKIILMAAIL